MACLILCRSMYVQTPFLTFTTLYVTVTNIASDWAYERLPYISLTKQTFQLLDVMESLPMRISLRFTELGLPPSIFQTATWQCVRLTLISLNEALWETKARRKETMIHVLSYPWSIYLNTFIAFGKLVSGKLQISQNWVLCWLVTCIWTNSTAQCIIEIETGKKYASNRVSSIGTMEYVDRNLNILSHAQLSLHRPARP